MNTILLLALFLAASLALQATTLWLAVRICRLPKRGFGRALAISVSRMVLVIGLWVALIGRDGDSGMMPAFWAASLLADTLLTVWLVRRAFGGDGWTVVGTWAVQAALGVVVGLGMMPLIQACIGAYVVPANSMSPNIRGFHVVQVQPDGRHLIVALPDPAGPFPERAGGPSHGIVAQTYESREVPQSTGERSQPDRIACNKSKPPTRWDAVVFRYPRQPDIVYVKRLVGLPGETIVISDGAVWVNGQHQTPPDRLGPIRYRGSFRLDGEDTPSEVISLGPDEFFVLGDNTNYSADSREWGPVPRDHIIGVADLIYWPPGRWRLGP